MPVIRPSVAVKAWCMWHFSLKATFKGTSQFTGLSNLFAKLFPSFVNSLSSRRNHGLHSMDLGETVEMKREGNIFVTFADCMNILAQGENHT